MANRTALFSRHQPGGVFTIADLPAHPGDIWFVDSGASGASDGVGYGRNTDKPFATIDYAIGQCTASNGDVIYVLPGHAETYSTTGAKITLDVIGVSIIGLGKGSARPTLTFGHTGATIAWTAASCSIENLLFVTSADSVVTFATISGADWALKNCETRDTTNVEVINAFTCTGDRGLVDGHYHNGYTGGDANVAVFTLAGVDGLEIKNSRFMTKVTTAVINITASSTNLEVHDCDFLVSSTTDLSKNMVSTGGSNTWSIWNCYDLGAGSAFSGGSGAAVAKDDVSVVSTAVSTAYALLTSSATSVATVGATATAVAQLASSIVSWDARYTTDLSYLRSDIDST
ncbi:MAG: hypothetical protein KJ597_07465 [Nanoarchaeota archaeon]|nr:hypothetical protein [Nanoarchaeota archaeon]